MASRFPILKQQRSSTDAFFGPQLFREREAPPRYYVMAGTAYLAFGGSATVTPLVDHFCALVHDYRGREMRPALEARGIQSAGVGMISDPDGLRLQLLGVPGGLAGTIVPGGRMSLDPPVVHAVGLDHVMLRVSDLEKSVAFYRTFFGNERPRTKDKPERVWFQVGNTRLGLEAAATRHQGRRRSLLHHRRRLRSPRGRNRIQTARRRVVSIQR